MIKLAVTKEEVERCWKFATEIIQGGNQYNRLHQNQETQITRTFVGKLAEYLFLHYLQAQAIDVPEGDMFNIYEGQNNVDNYDFVLPNGQTIDIKTASLSFHSRIMVPEDQFRLRKDYYVGIRLIFEEENRRIKIPPKIAMAEIHGFITRDDFAGKPVENFGEGPCKAATLAALQHITPLIRMFHEP